MVTTARSSLQRFGTKEPQYGQAVAAIVKDVIVLGASKSWLSELCTELLTGIIHSLPFR